MSIAAPPTDVDRNAPVIAHHEIDIAAPLDRVWQLHVNVGDWPTWNLEVSAAKLDEAFVPGSSFTWTCYDFSLTSTIYCVEDRARVLWSLAAKGISGTHEWLFQPTPQGVHVTTNESFGGPAVEADTATWRAVIDNSLTAWLGRMKARAEAPV